MIFFHLPPSISDHSLGKIKTHLSIPSRDSPGLGMYSERLFERLREPFTDVSITFVVTFGSTEKLSVYRLGSGIVKRQTLEKCASDQTWIFSVLRGGNAGFFTTRSKISIVFFLLSVNIYLAQLWADTCRKFSPIEYLECIYIQDDSRLDPGKKVYLPETLMTATEREDLKRRQMRAAMPGSAGSGGLVTVQE